MKRLQFVLVASIVYGACAMAQSANPHEGKWLAQVKSPTGHTFDADVAVKGEGGTFQYILMNRVKSDACFTMEAPIVVTRATAEDFDFVIKRSAIPGCTDANAKLHRVDDKTFSGKVGTQDATLVRK
jgi:hypothetical protein